MRLVPCVSESERRLVLAFDEEGSDTKAEPEIKGAFIGHRPTFQTRPLGPEVLIGLSGSEKPGSGGRGIRF